MSNAQNQVSDSVACPHVSFNGSDAKSWFAVFTVPRHEKRVEAHLRVRQIESFLPLYQRKRQWKDGSKGMLQVPLFANYIFVRIGCDGRVPVLRVPGVRAIVGWGPQPISIPDSYLASLREGLQQGKIEPYPYLGTGVRVHIRSGVMAGMEGVLLRKKNDFRVVVTLEMIKRSVAVELEIEDIEPIGGISYALASQLAASA